MENGLNCLINLSFSNDFYPFQTIIFKQILWTFFNWAWWWKSSQTRWNTSFHLSKRSHPWNLPTFYRPNLESTWWLTKGLQKEFNLYAFNLFKPVSFGSSFYETKISSIYIFPGKGDPNDNYPIQRVDSENFKTDIIGYHGTDHLVPVLFHAEHDFCVWAHIQFQ